MNGKVLNLFCCNEPSSEPEIAYQILPDDVMILVFELLDGDSLKEAALVCKSWNLLIGTTPSVMNKFELTLRNNSAADKTLLSLLEKNLGRFSKRFSSISVVTDGERGFGSMKKSLMHFGPHLQKLKFYCISGCKTCVHSLTVGSLCFSEVLRKMPLLKTLDLHSVVIKPEAVEERVLMTHLEELKLGLNNKFVVNIISAPKLQSFESLTLDSFDMKKLIPMLKLTTPNHILSEKDNLETVYYHCTKNKKPVATLRLKTLDTWEDFKVQEKKAFDLFHEFLRSQADSLTTFKFRSMASAHDPFGLYEIIFKELKALTTLTLNFKLMPIEEDFYKQMKPLLHLSNVYVRDTFPSEGAAKHFFKLCPNLVALEATQDEVIPHLLTFLSIHNPGLERLVISTVRTGNTPTMPSLKVLHTMYFEDFNASDEIQAINPQVDFRGGVGRWY